MYPDDIKISKPKDLPKGFKAYRRNLYLKYLFWFNRLKKRKVNFEKLLVNSLIATAFVSILIGLIIFIFFLYKLSNEYSISGDKVLLTETAQVGDFIGGVIGAIWALTGILLFYAALRLQSRELAENRKHFQMSRLTDIIYKQLDIFYSHLPNFKLKDIERNDDDEFAEYDGRAAMTLIELRSDKIIESQAKELSEEERQVEMYRFMGESFVFIDINKNELNKFYKILNTQVNVVRSILIKDEMPPEDLNELKNLFFRNIGQDFLRASEMLIHTHDWYFKYKKDKGEPIDNLFSIESSTKRSIATIIEFWKTKYDKNNIKDFLKHREMYNNSQL